MISITVSSPERSHVEYTQVPPPIYPYVISLVVSLPIRSGPGVLMNISVYNNNDDNKNNNYYYVTCEIFALQGCYAARIAG